MRAAAVMNGKPEIGEKSSKQKGIWIGGSGRGEGMEVTNTELKISGKEKRKKEKKAAKVRDFRRANEVVFQTCSPVGP